MYKYSDTVLAGGVPAVGASVLVSLYPTGAATIYSDDGVTPITGSKVTTDNFGTFSFYAAAGRYTLTVSGTGLTTRTVEDVQIEEDLVNLSSTAHGNGASLVGIEDAGGLFTATNVEAALQEPIADNRISASAALALSKLASQSAYSLVGNNTSGSAVPTAVSNDALLVKASGSTAERSLGDRFIDLAYVGKDWGLAWDNATDDATALNAVLAAIGTAGGGVVQLPRGTGLVGATIYLPDFVELRGHGRNATTLKLKSGTNADIIQKHASYNGYNAVIRNLTIDGNDANNTSGGIYWAGSSGSRGPSLLMQNVKVTNMRGAVGGGGLGAAMLLTGSDWSVLEDVDFWQNVHAVGLWVKSSDSVFTRLYMASNGTTAGVQALVVQQAVGNRFTDGYFGGGTGSLEQVALLGARYTTFTNCINDSSGREGYRFRASGGIDSSNNQIVGGAVTNPSQSASNTYDHITFEDAANGNAVIGVRIDNTLANKGRYGIAESGTATANRIAGVTFGTMGTGNTNLLSAGTSTVDGVKSGTWTPVMEGDATAGTQTYNNQYGWYRKDGDLVTAGFYIRLASKDAATAGSLRVGGLPFMSANTTDQYGGAIITQYKIDLDAGYSQLGLQVAPNTTKAALIENGDNVAASTIAAANLLADTNIMAVITYVAA